MEAASSPPDPGAVAPSDTESRPKISPLAIAAAGCAILAGAILVALPTLHPHDIRRVGVWNLDLALTAAYVALACVATPLLAVGAAFHISRSGGRRKGNVLAVLAMVLGPGTLLAVEAWPHPDHRPESSVAGSLRSIYNAQQIFKDTAKSRQFLGAEHPTFSPDLRNLYDPGLRGDPTHGTFPDQTLAETAAKARYIFGSAQGVGDGDCTRGGTLDVRYQWEIFASPTDPEDDRWFWISEVGTIRATTDPHAPPPRTDTSGAWTPLD